MNELKATIDFESRSACNLRACGAWRYSVDPSTQILCLAFRLPDWPQGQTSLWHPEIPGVLPGSSDDEPLVELFEWIEAGKPIEAHNAWFERCLWKNILVPLHGFPEIASVQWRCSAAKAAAAALPRKLEDAGAALQLTTQKDSAGHKLMLKLSKPRKPRKAEKDEWKTNGRPHLWWESPELFERLFSYCRTDVLAEAELSDALADLCPSELAVYLFDQSINERGFQLDRGGVSCALSLIDSETARLNEELSLLTDGTVSKATQRTQIKNWLGTEGVYLVNTQKATVEEMLKELKLKNTPVAEYALQILQQLGKSSTAKYTAMQNWMDPHDARVRGGLLYHGATTGRWSGSGVQPHNFPKGNIKDMVALWDTLQTASREDLEATYGSVIDALSQGLRGAIVPRPQSELFVADYASIEARVVMWLADDQDALNIFRQDQDIYCDMASSIYDRVITKVDKDERQVGKFAILGLGYGMGVAKFVATCGTFGVALDDQFAQEVVNTYRTKYWRVKQMWYDTEASAIECVHTGDDIQSGRVTFSMSGPVPHDQFLYCVLPSGRTLSYPFPEVRLKQTPWGENKPCLTFMGLDGYSHTWNRQHTYGGSLVENITQAVSRDIMAEAMLRCEAAGYDVVLSVHDEVLAERLQGQGDVKEFEGLLTQHPMWAEGCPIAAEGWKGLRYRK